MDLEHSGIKGQKWGRRRFQYEDGSLTPAGLLRYRKTASDQDLRKGKERLDLENSFLESYKKVYGDTYTNKRKFKKDYKRMTDEEIKSITYRLGLENDYLKAKSIIREDQKALYRQEHRIKGFFKYTVPDQLLSPVALRAAQYGIEEMLGIPHKEHIGKDEIRYLKAKDEYIKERDEKAREEKEARDKKAQEEKDKKEAKSLKEKEAKEAKAKKEAEDAENLAKYQKMVRDYKEPEPEPIYPKGEDIKDRYTVLRRQKESQEPIDESRRLSAPKTEADIRREERQAQQEAREEARKAKQEAKAREDAERVKARLRQQERDRQDQEKMDREYEVEDAPRTQETKAKTANERLRDYYAKPGDWVDISASEIRKALELLSKPASAYTLPSGGVKALPQSTKEDVQRAIYMLTSGK